MGLGRDDRVGARQDGDGAEFKPFARCIVQIER
jgi:hypothetical protein